MSKTLREPDSLDVAELVMALEEELEESSGVAGVRERLERWKRYLTAEQAQRLLPYSVAPLSLLCKRNGFETQATLIARRSNVGLAIDHGCGQFAVGSIVREAELQGAQHFSTMELALRAFERG